MTRELTGRHVLLIAIAAFGVIVAANLTMLFSATGTFPGLVVKNAYVASQGWNDRVAAQEALGWQAEFSHRADAILITLTDNEGRPVRDAALTATLGRPTTDAEDRTYALAWTDAGYEIPVALTPGSWRIDLEAAGDVAFRKTATLRVTGRD